MLSAVEVLEWLKDWSYTTKQEPFECANDMYGLFACFTSQEIVDRIEKYEAEKNGLVSNSDEFEVGDWVKCISTGDIGKITSIAYYLGEQGQVEFNDKWTEISDVEHAEPPTEMNECKNCPKYDSLTDNCEINMNCHLAYENDCESNEEKQKIEKFTMKPDEVDDFNGDTLLRMGMLINELVDAINELRGV